MKKIICLFIALIMLFELSMPVFAVQTQADNQEEKSNKLSDLKTTATVRGVTLPTKEYPVGSHFTDNGGNCYDHRTGVCGYSSESQCNCKAYYNGVCLRGVQCYGYANYLYYRCFGNLGYKFDKFNNANLGTIEWGEVTVAKFKELMKQSVPGSHLRVIYYKPDGVTISTHSLIILDWNEAGFSACESNLDAHCGTFVMRRSYKEYVPCLISVEFFSIPRLEQLKKQFADFFEIFKSFFTDLSPFGKKETAYSVGNIFVEDFIKKPFELN